MTSADIQHKLAQYCFPHLAIPLLWHARGGLCWQCSGYGPVLLISSCALLCEACCLFVWGSKSGALSTPGSSCTLAGQQQKKLDQCPHSACTGIVYKAVVTRPTWGYHSISQAYWSSIVNLGMMLGKQGVCSINYSATWNVARSSSLASTSQWHL